MNAGSQKMLYDCDTSPYWCSDEDYNERKKKFGSVVSNRGLGFTWYRLTLLRITKYEHQIYYLPCDFPEKKLPESNRLKT
jgi:hypothetical protein